MAGFADVISARQAEFSYKNKLHDNVPDAVHASGTATPKDSTPPSERWRVVPNRKARRKAQRDMIKRAKRGR